MSFSSVIPKTEDHDTVINAIVCYDLNLYHFIVSHFSIRAIYISKLGSN